MPPSRPREHRAKRIPVHNNAYSALLFIAAVVGLNSGFAKESILTRGQPESPDPRFVVDQPLASDDFQNGLALWRPELEKGGTVAASKGTLEIDVPGGCTIWFTRVLTGPLMISYEATVVDAGGPNDRVSDLNCFWMASDSRSPADMFGITRSGKFSDYDQLRCYYVGLGGNSNTTTRFRRYIGEKGNRPLLPGYDLGAREFLLAPNTPLKIQLIAAGSVVGYYPDGRRLFGYEDPHPYSQGWFAFRSVSNHLRIANFQVFRLLAKGTAGVPGAAAKFP
jgi:hypothetical protein